MNATRYSSRRRFAALSLAVALAIFAWGFFSGGPLAAAVPDGKKLEVVFFDVGQGDASLITTPSGFRVLIDGGEGEAPFNQGQDRRDIHSYLRRAGIERLDVIVLTHAHFDHLGGLIPVLEDKRIAVGEVLDSGVPHPSQYYSAFLQAVQNRKEIKYRQPRLGEFLQWGAEVTVRVLGPSGRKFDKLNDSSLVLKLSFGDISFLFVGDAEAEAEKKLLRQWGFSLRSAVLKTGHHGSATSSSAEFLRSVNPRLAVISVGAYNRFGHPAPETIKQLTRARAKIYRTDRHGTVTVTTDGKELWVKTEKEEQE